MCQDISRYVNKIVERQGFLFNNINPWFNQNPHNLQKYIFKKVKVRKYYSGFDKIDKARQI